MNDTCSSFEQSKFATLWSEPLFDETSARELFLVVGRGAPPIPDAPAYVAAMLNDLAINFALDRWAEFQPGVSEDEKSAKRLALACRKVPSRRGHSRPGRCRAG